MLYDQQSSPAGALSVDDVEAYWRAVEDHALVAITDRRGIIVDVNDRFCLVSGYAREELIGNTHRRVSSGRHTRDFWRKLWGDICAARVWHGEICNRARSGSEYWVDSTVVPLRRGNVPWGYIAVCHLITDQRHGHEPPSWLDQRDFARDSVLNSVSYAVFATNSDMVLTAFNRGAERVLGYVAPEVVGYARLPEILAPQGHTSLREWLENLHTADAGAVHEDKCVLMRCDGKGVPVFLSLTSMQDRWGRFTGLLGVAYDVSDLDRVETALRESERRFHHLYQAAPLGIVRSRLSDGAFIEANPAFREMTGYSEQDLYGLTIHDVSPPVSGMAETKLRDELRGHGSFGPVEREGIRKDGTRFQILVHGMRDRTADGQASVWTLVQDITERKRMETQLRQAAFLDRLTGLANRTLMNEHLACSIQHHGETPQNRFALLYIDLDDFKSVNDSLGRGAGDRLLQQVVGRLLDALQTIRLSTKVRTMPGRLGGDEFLVLLEGAKAPEASAEVSRRIIEELSRPCRLGERIFHLSASIGIVASDAEYEIPDDYVRDAEMAMYEAKRAGRHRYCLFDATLRDRIQRRVAIRNALPGALEHGEMHLLYQPIMNLDTGLVAGCEALLRWNSPLLGQVSPMEFIPIAEESGMIIALGDWVLRQACMQFASWRAVFPANAPDALYLNVSRAQLVMGDFDCRVAEVLESCAIEPERVHLEITETAIMRDTDEALRLIGELRRRGVNFELDDFGTGYSSLGSLHELPIDGIKIDRSFISRLDDSERVLAVTESVAGLARRLGMSIVAEGIETPTQLQVVRALGCHFGQGFLLARPLSAGQFTDDYLAAARQT